MIVEITHEMGHLIGEYESSVAPRVGETIYYDDVFYNVEKARSDVDAENYQLEKFAVLVSEVGEE